MKRKIQQKKLKEVEEIKNLASKYSVLGLVDMTNLPSLQLQRMRQQLRDTLFLKMAKKRLIRINEPIRPDKGIPNTPPTIQYRNLEQESS